METAAIGTMQKKSMQSRGSRMIRKNKIRQNRQIGSIGLGIMGGAFARHLLSDGFLQKKAEIGAGH